MFRCTAASSRRPNSMRYRSWRSARWSYLAETVGQASSDISAVGGMTQLIMSTGVTNWPLWLQQAGAKDLGVASRLEFGFGLLASKRAVEGLGVAVAQPEYVEEECTQRTADCAFFATSSQRARGTSSSARITSPWPAVARFLRGSRQSCDCNRATTDRRVASRTPRHRSMAVASRERIVEVPRFFTCTRGLRSVEGRSRPHARIRPHSRLTSPI